jgi:hypothetical protein
MHTVDVLLPDEDWNTQHQQQQTVEHGLRAAAVKCEHCAAPARPAGSENAALSSRTPLPTTDARFAQCLSVRKPENGQTRQALPDHSRAERQGDHFAGVAP